MALVTIDTYSSCLSKKNALTIQRRCDQTHGKSGVLVACVEGSEDWRDLSVGVGGGNLFCAVQPLCWIRSV